MKSFLQSKEWEEFQKSLGRETFWVDGKLLIKLPLVLGQNYLYSPRPEFKNPEDAKFFVGHVKKIAKRGTHIFFLRFEPCCAEEMLHPHDCLCHTFKKVKAKQPENSLILDLAGKSEETILAQMKQKTRYNIRLSEKKGVKVRVSNNPADIDIFYNLGLETAQRDQIKFHPREYYQKMMEILGSKDLLKLYLAYYEDKPIAAILVLFYGKTAYYLHGASSNSHRNLMAPYLLQWQAIRDAKKAGIEEYDFWGVAPPKDFEKKIDSHAIKVPEGKPEYEPDIAKLIQENTDHPWAGITRFKFGFAPNGKIVHYPGCFEVVFRQGRYLLYSFLRRK